MTVRDNGDCIGVLLYSYYTTITGRGVVLKYYQGSRVEDGTVRVLDLVEGPEPMLALISDSGFNDGLKLS